ncbi:hypothetical protein GCM10010840_00070 [Deinococcus aerolatus]|uniref:Uncharacterized protein n=1 Tax=Deinococcus aerolatus TaxID=522487 RepID=A0ABQ2FYF8_9DEIO|nr:hypothetical protein [Deinococcus aerolatus]GGL66149.1 hypothetical protein GCM10010840_00070 [Deinococcus aerolatus]
MTRMFGTSLCFIVAGFLVVLFIPVIPVLGATQVPGSTAKPDGSPTASD